MKIAFFSNFLNHHQLPLCEEFNKKQDVEFVFVATEPISQDRLDMGYADMNKQYSFVLRSYEEGAEEKAMKIAEEFDVVIFGAAPLKYLEKRMQKDKLTFYFCERPLKKGYWRRFIPITRRKLNNAFIKFKNKPLYLLGASAYASYDLKLCGFNEKKCFKWGYFPKIETKNLTKLLSLKNNNNKVEILYAGRILKLKRVIDFVKAVKILVCEGESNLHFTIIGDGEEKNNIEKYIADNKIDKYITILPFKTPSEVRCFMEGADIYVFGSDFNEGWGAVVNEAMNSACALVVSHAVGSVPYLIKNGDNGLIYQCGKVEEIARNLKILIENKKLRDQIGENAYKTITKHWTAEVAATRLIAVAEKIQQGETPFFEEGVCSCATPIKNYWIKKEKENIK
ncbi:MAG: glycosyltransferase family 4 protein [Clostridiales bacterium]|nr:glycosyltransferase family 4 protein [Clostridiales bacterium]